MLVCVLVLLLVLLLFVNEEHTSKRNMGGPMKKQREISMQITCQWVGQGAGSCEQATSETPSPGLTGLFLHRPVMQAILKRHTVAPDPIFHTHTYTYCSGVPTIL